MPVPVRDAQTLRRALESGGDEVSVTLSRYTVELMTQVVEAEAYGDEVSPAQAAHLLGVSRPHVRTLMDRGDIPFRMVGTHHRIPLADLRQYQDAERRRRRTALTRFSELENELGL